MGEPEIAKQDKQDKGQESGDLTAEGQDIMPDDLRATLEGKRVDIKAKISKIKPLIANLPKKMRNVFNDKITNIEKNIVPKNITSAHYSAFNQELDTYANEVTSLLDFLDKYTKIKQKIDGLKSSLHSGSINPDPHRPNLKNSLKELEDKFQNLKVENYANQETVDQLMIVLGLITQLELGDEQESQSGSLTNLKEEEPTDPKDGQEVEIPDPIFTEEELSKIRKSAQIDLETLPPSAKQKIKELLQNPNLKPLPVSKERKRIDGKEVEVENIKPVNIPAQNGKVEKYIKDMCSLQNRINEKYFEIKRVRKNEKSGLDLKPLEKFFDFENDRIKEFKFGTNKLDEYIKNAQTAISAFEKNLNSKLNPVDKSMVWIEKNFIAPFASFIKLICEAFGFTEALEWLQKEFPDYFPEDKEKKSLDERIAELDKKIAAITDTTKKTAFEDEMKKIKEKREKKEDFMPDLEALEKKVNAESDTKEIEFNTEKSGLEGNLKELEKNPDLKLGNIRVKFDLISKREGEYLAVDKALIAIKELKSELDKHKRYDELWKRFQELNGKTDSKNQNIKNMVKKKLNKDLTTLLAEAKSAYDSEKIDDGLATLNTIEGIVKELESKKTENVPETISETKMIDLMFETIFSQIKSDFIPGLLSTKVKDLMELRDDELEDKLDVTWTYWSDGVQKEMVLFKDVMGQFSKKEDISEKLKNTAQNLRQYLIAIFKSPDYNVFRTVLEENGFEKDKLDKLFDAYKGKEA